MEAKEAIEWIFDIWHEWENIYGSNTTENLKSGHKLDKVIDLLKRSETDSKELKIVREELKRVWQMWEEFYDIASEFNFFPLMDKIKQKYFPKEEYPTPYTDRGLDGTMDILNEYRRKNLKEIARLEALIKEESKCDHCGYKQIVTSLKEVWGELTP